MYDDNEMADFPVTHCKVITLQHLLVFAFISTMIILAMFFHSSPSTEGK